MVEDIELAASVAQVTTFPPGVNRGQNTSTTSLMSTFWPAPESSIWTPSGNVTGRVAMIRSRGCNRDNVSACSAK